ncbi:MAG: hypothetical protein NZ455_14355 [Bacteroidia bacterium]|nr:hypothetical protein [Bacteroidia bacterium]
MRRASRQAWCEAPSPCSQTLAQGVGGWGAAPSARSTPTLWAYAQRNAHKDTPKKISKHYACSLTPTTVKRLTINSGVV